jgi:hypothetical protein
LYKLITIDTLHALMYVWDLSVYLIITTQRWI